MTTTVSYNSVEAGAQITRGNASWGASIGAAAGPISFGFRAAAPSYTVVDWSQDNAQEMAAARTALGLWADVARITFTEVNPGGYTNNATILFGNFNDAGNNDYAYAYRPTTKNTAFTSTQGDVWMNLAKNAFTSDGFGTYNFEAFLHEIGHALGLQHPGDYDASSGLPITYANDALYIEDSRQYTVMSYFKASETGANFVYGGVTIHASTPLMDDISAMQRLYGANTTTRTGDTVYGFGSNAGAAYTISSATQQKVFCIWDAGGNDTLNLSGYGDNQVIDLNPGSFCDAGALTKNISIALGVIIENAVGGSGNDTFYGNTANNAINGGGGFDTVVFSGNANEYTVTRVGGSVKVVDSFVGGDGTDTVSNVEYISFADRSINLTMGAEAAKISAGTLNSLIDLYIAYFNRVPEASGLAYWIDKVAAGESLSAVSAEFYNAGIHMTSVSGYSASMSNSDFIKIIYANVLQRSGSIAPSASEVSYWNNQLNTSAVTKEGLIQKMLSDARGFASDPTWGWVTNVLNNKDALGKYHAVDLGIDYNSAADAVHTTVELAAAVTPVGIGAAVAMIGLSGHVML